MATMHEMKVGTETEPLLGKHFDTQVGVHFLGEDDIYKFRSVSIRLASAIKTEKLQYLRWRMYGRNFDRVRTGS